MTRIWLIARREALEQWRQPVMLVVIASLFALVSTAGAGVVHLLHQVTLDPSTAQLLADIGAFGPDALPALVRSALSLLSFLGFSQYLGIAAVLAGHGMLHERQCGTLTFLLLAPVRRLELLAGKVLGAMAWPTLLYLTLVGAGSLLAAASPSSAAAPHLTPRSVGWWITFLLAGPLWASAIATACTLISAVARDVRSAQQGVWFLVFFATLGAGTVLTASLGSGWLMPLLSCAAAATLTATLAFAGTVVLSGDLSR